MGERGDLALVDLSVVWDSNLHKTAVVRIHGYYMTGKGKEYIVDLVAPELFEGVDETLNVLEKHLLLISKHHEEEPND